MPFTTQELANITNATLDYHYKPGKVYTQSVQNKPLLREMLKRDKPFAGGKENITVRVKGDYTTTIQGYTHDDIVDYANPANIKTAVYPWKEIHWGIKVTLTELKKDGISVNDSQSFKSGTSAHSDREKFALANLLDDKIEDMKEGSERELNEMFWEDGTQDAKEIPGIKSFIVDDPTAATIVGGIDQSTNEWWRNRAIVGTPIDCSNFDNQNLVTTLQQEFRQLRRYGSPKHLFLAGSDFLEAMEGELRAKGVYTQTGWAKEGYLDASMADVAFKGVRIEYDPTLDDKGMSDRGYVLDTNVIMPMYMEGEKMKPHNPARPENQYVIHKAVTHTGGLVCRQRNTSGVYKITLS